MWGAIVSQAEKNRIVANVLKTESHKYSVQLRESLLSEAALCTLPSCSTPPQAQPSPEGRGGEEERGGAGHTIILILRFYLSCKPLLGFAVILCTSPIPEMQEHG